MTFLRTLMLLALVIWVGGIIFFSFAVAPTAFTVLPSTALAGNVVSRSLTILHWMGIVSAAVFLGCSVLYDSARSARLKAVTLANALVLIMLVFTLVSQFGVMRRMQALREELHAPDQVAVVDTARQEFDRLHQWSTRLEGGTLFLGLIVVVLTARRFS